MGIPLPLNQLERIGQLELSENLDAILERIDKEDTGFVITEDGVDKYVLCPYKWFNPFLDPDFGSAMNSTIRAAFQSSSDDSQAIQDFVRNHCMEFNVKTMQTAIDDIEYHLTAEPSTVSKPAPWRELANKLQQELNQKKQGGAT